MKDDKPLLQDEEEKFAFLESNTKPKREIKFSKEKVTTIILSVFVAWLLWYSFYPFYVGFIYYKETHEIVTTVPQTGNEEEVSVTSMIVSDTYKLIDTRDTDLLFTSIYSNNLVSIDTLDNSAKLAIVFKYLGINCDNNTSFVSFANLEDAALKIFNSNTFMQDINTLIGQNIYGYNITLENDAYKIVLNTCTSLNNYTYKKITKATKDIDYLYIYEAFGYFVNEGNNEYSVYDDALKQNKVTTYSGDANSFDNVSLLKTYKWTFAKNNNDTYYFVSVMQES